MNRSVCEVCRRFERDTHKRPNVWMCAEHIWLERSDVIPGHSFIKRDGFHYMTAECSMPAWCERTLEQTILAPDEKAEVMPDAQIVFDGNKDAERKREAVIANTNNAGRYVTRFPISAIWQAAPITDDVFK